MRLVTRLVWGMVVAGVTAWTAQAQSAPDRFALVFGNTGYERRADGKEVVNSPINLRSPENDARAYIGALEGLGWEVLNTSFANRTAAGLQNDLDKAARRITAGSEVVFIFNGHGFSEGDRNYLVGVPEDGERYASVGDMRVGSIDLEDVVDRLSQGSPARIVMIINACGDEPLVTNTSQAPARPRFDERVSEILVLYSSSPKGIAYDWVDTDDLEQPADEVLSAFTRTFQPIMSQDRPLLSLFTEARLEVERLTVAAASARNRPDRQGLQIPHVLFDTINGQFNLADASDTSVDAVQFADWRLQPQSCRFNPDSLGEALQLRDGPAALEGAEEQAVKSCILAAALGDLGIQRLSFDDSRRGVVVALSGPDAVFRNKDLISMANVTPSGENRQRYNFRSLDIFRDMLSEHYFTPGHNITFAWKRNDGTLPGSGFTSRDF
ncbi:MAG: caspase family protein [Pseudomonadota bacterium]